MNKSYRIPNDFNIYSALSTGKVSDSVLTALFLKRGIILSNQTSREEKANYFATFMHGYYDFETISAQHSKVDRVEYTSSINIQTGLSVSDLSMIMSKLDSKLEDKFSNIQLKDVETNIRKDQVIVEFDYEKFHPDKQMFSQIENKKATIIFKRDSATDTYYVEHPATPEMIRWSTSVQQILKENDDKISINNIDLTGLTNPELYWQFFDELTSVFDKYKRTNVIEVLFKNPNKDDDSDDETICQLISATYKGNQLHLSEDFKARLDDGYLLHKFTWDCIDSTFSTSDKYRLSIKVTYDDEGKSNFSFISKGFYKYKEGKHSKTINAISSSQDREFNKLIFKKGIELIDSLTTTPVISLMKHNNEVVSKSKEA
ncbi:MULTISPECIES: hypothetical protein [Acinetobacter calcoaceticus/baumannii complex]|uniref:hypothetical protein n=1 Tax=Acinetobacter calcoaceticus/baumannii complex TaxID=909768 RepID=UPI00062A95BF|nr:MULTISPECIES: hypothetical protein [Acinetobacter calcoaceticus/baumannii complex]MBJ9417506.1 hypothetical protein [Acinetobacter baumannii]TGU86581.1 hypothetical protein YA64_011785 [Acinetobacter pittii]